MDDGESEHTEEQRLSASRKLECFTSLVELMLFRYLEDTQAAHPHFPASVHKRRAYPEVHIASAS